MTATTELREAAERIRDVVERIETLSVYQSGALKEALKEHTDMGFTRAPLALATAAWLDQEADTLDLLSIEPTTSLEVARHILKAAA